MSRRNARNRDFERGFGNRTDGLFKKANTFHSTYGVRVAAIVIGRSGRIKAYCSDPSLLAELNSSSAQWDFTCGPESFVTLASGRSASAGFGGRRPSSPRQATQSISSDTSISLSFETFASLPSSSSSSYLHRSFALYTPPMSASDVMDSVEVCVQPSDMDLGLPSMYLFGGDLANAARITHAAPAKTARHTDPDIKAPTPLPTHRRTRALLSRLADECSQI